MTDHEHTALTAEERRILAEIEASLAGDPGRPPSVGQRPPLAVSLVLVLVGLVVVVATFARAVWLTPAGLVLMVFGLKRAIETAMAQLDQARLEGFHGR